MKIREEALQHVKERFSAMREARRPNWPIWRDLADIYLPYSCPWLLNKQQNEKLQLNPNFLTSTGLSALRTQTAGLMNGITSPTRPWFSLGVGPDNSLLKHSSRQWLAVAQQIMLNVLARSNYYNIMAMSYFDLGLMASSGMQMFEDVDNVVRFQRFNTGEFYVEYDFTGKVRRYGREFFMPLSDIVQQFKLENLPTQMQAQYKNPTSRATKYRVYHFVERKGNDPELGHPADRLAWREVYWMANTSELSEVLAIAGFREQPATFPRWSAELELGNSPAMDALADMKELRHIILKKGVGLEKIIDPPMLIDAALRNQPKSMMPGGHSYVPNLGAATGARPAYTLNIPIQELRLEIKDLELSIREIFHNDLFKMISQLDTVRSATEIDARREEKLVMLANFLERFENEQLDPVIERLFAICLRSGLFPDPPLEIQNADIDIKYISILSTAQRAIATAPLERLLGMVGQVAGIAPEVLDIVNFDEFVYSYGTDIGANPTVLRDQEQLAARRQAREEQLAQAQAMQTGASAVQAAQQLSETDVGGGANALQRILS
jgi:hypothetical protein